ncbi:MAG: MgtC/SapB family protein [Azonexus sp.]|jgi:putative Mg2+ transporter-C (MgtC) family protein|nr:MgtC/SapB family protein [Azonexus sp.]
MDSDYAIISTHLIGALIAGGLIGIERSFRARPAGFRTHTLVCLASSLLMLVTLYQWKWLPGVPMDTIRTDPTRMAQGIMTGIGFLGAGVIFKEGLSVRGLTTAASIWMTAAIGILMGIGFYMPAILATALTIGVLSAFRWIETRLPSDIYAHHALRFRRDDVLAEPEVREFLQRYGFTVANISYRITEDGAFFEYKMILRTRSAENTVKLAEALRTMPRLHTFRISPTGD